MSGQTNISWHISSIALPLCHLWRNNHFWNMHLTNNNSFFSYKEKDQVFSFVNIVTSSLHFCSASFCYCCDCNPMRYKNTFDIVIWNQKLNQSVIKLLFWTRGNSSIKKDLRLFWHIYIYHLFNLQNTKTVAGFRIQNKK